MANWKQIERAIEEEEVTTSTLHDLRTAINWRLSMGNRGAPGVIQNAGSWTFSDGSSNKFIPNPNRVPGTASMAPRNPTLHERPLKKYDQYRQTDLFPTGTAGMKRRLS